MGFLHYLNDYLSARVRHAIRVNPRVANIIDDIVWAQVTNLRMVLEKQKGFGPERIRVADVLASENDLRRKALFSHSDQNSIIYEIINKADDQKRAMSETAVHNMRTFFRALDPSLEMIVELIQHWLLWDLMDASLLHNFDEQIRRLSTLCSMEINEDLRNRYRTALHKKIDDPLPDSEIIAMELKRLEHQVQQFLQRRAEEEAYMAIVRRDEHADSASGHEIQALAEHIRSLEEIENGEGELDPALVEKYAEEMQVAPASLTREKAVDYERNLIAEGKRLLQRYLQDDRRLGEPYDYKKHQAEMLKQRHAQELQQCERRMSASHATQADAEAHPVEQ
jgi:hypothetical protein